MLNKCTNREQCTLHTLQTNGVDIITSNKIMCYTIRTPIENRNRDVESGRERECS